MFGHFSTQLAAAATSTKSKDPNSTTTDNGKKTSMSPSLRSDVYTAIDLAKAWITSTPLSNTNNRTGHAGDGISFSPLLTLIQKHLPNHPTPNSSPTTTTDKTQSEITSITAGITNLILEYSKWETMSSAMAMRTWVDALVSSYENVPPTASASAGRKQSIARGITNGVNLNSDPSLMTKDFTAKIQIISYLKSVSSKIYGKGTEDARQAEALCNSRFI